jgi:DNA polymerase-3 subunit gamma/tau
MGMSYQVLARKWRPQVFEDVVGQAHITRTLQNAIASGRLAHAFLFSGPRGVGKTTTARILAKALNCAEGPTPTPCGTCNSCRETAAGTSMDVVEIDGASNRGIEHIRELREAVKYAPAGGKYKVYVIDEVHMLTNEAFNALLKTLEEPPPHVIFIFATTEPQKIPATILSRCQRYGFKRVSLQEITGRLHRIADAEGISITDQGLALIARAAEGSMRDSQSLLDQAVSYCGLTIQEEDLEVTLGSVPQQTLMAFTAGLISRDSARLLKEVDLLLERGQDLRQVLSGVVEHLRNLLVLKIAIEPSQMLDLSAVDIEVMKAQAGSTTTEQLLLLFDSLSKTLDDLRWSPHQRFTFEVGLIKACSLAPLKPLTEVLGRIGELEAKIAPGVAPRHTAGDTVRESPAAYTSLPPSETPGLSAAAVMGGSHDDAWSRILARVKAKKPALATFLSGSRVVEQTDDELLLAVQGSSFQISQIEKQENRALIEAAAKDVLNRPIRMRLQPLPGESKSSPKAKTVDKDKRKSPEQDPLVQDALRIFGGEVVEQERQDE